MNFKLEIALELGYRIEDVPGEDHGIRWVHIFNPEGTEIESNGYVFSYWPEYLKVYALPDFEPFSLPLPEGYFWLVTFNEVDERYTVIVTRNSTEPVDIRGVAYDIEDAAYTAWLGFRRKFAPKT